MVHRRSLTLPGRFCAAVFDLDGLLVATEPAWAAAEAALLAARGRGYTDADRLATIGRSLDESVTVYGARIGLPPSRLGDLRAELIARLLAQLPAVEVMPGVHEIVPALAAVMPLAVASSSPRVVVDAALAAAGLAGTFGVVISADDVDLPKPAPDAYLLACRRLGVAPSDAVAFEDSGPGIRAAVDAGLWCVAVPSDPAIDSSAAHLTLTSMEAIVLAPDVRARS